MEEILSAFSGSCRVFPFPGRTGNGSTCIIRRRRGKDCGISAEDRKTREGSGFPFFYTLEAPARG